MPIDTQKTPRFPTGGLFFFLFLTFLLGGRAAYAVPYFAVYSGASCSHCHVNPTGAGMRNEHGINLLSEFSLTATRHLFQQEFKGQLTKYFAFGGDVRLRHLATVESPQSNSFSVPQGSLYVRADPISHFSVYTDTDVANLVSREVYGFVHKLPANLWIKFGRFNLPYGLRTDDDSSFIRNDLGFSFSAQDIGVEIGLEPGPFQAALAYTNGVPGGNVDDNEDKAVTASAAWVSKHARVGGSFQWNNRATTRTLMGGGHAGFTVWKFAVLGEVDVQKVEDKVTGGERTVLAGYGEADYQVIPGLYLRAIYDVIDDKLATGGLHHRIGAGFELFPIPYLKVAAIYRIRIGRSTLGDDQIFTVFHGFF
jgi:hypothetical protein